MLPQIDDLEAEADPLKSAGEEGYPSQKGELEAVRDIYGDYDLQEEDEKSLEACENLEEDLLEAVVELQENGVGSLGDLLFPCLGEWNWPSRRNKTMKLRLPSCNYAFGSSVFAAENELAEGFMNIIDETNKVIQSNCPQADCGR